MVDASATIAIRAMSQADRPYIAHSWLSTAHESPQWRHVPSRLFAPRHRYVVETILARAPALVAVLEDSPETILGFVVAEPGNVLHYVHVKAKFRRFGIARDLLEAAAIDTATCTYTHFTSDARRHLLASDRASYDPYLLFGAAFIPSQSPSPSTTTGVPNGAAEPVEPVAAAEHPDPEGR